MPLFDSSLCLSTESGIGRLASGFKQEKRLDFCSNTSVH